ncbi:MAG TPA: pyridine nucleotide-disulfide oxidoreductase [Firmicutes bacterium]|nr:pyridine nucleotide-disulfide oxidoreductase [Bacillota bacterium]
MIYKDVIIIGGGPAGLCAAKILADQDVSVLLVDRDHHLGGQLVKQTHKFFGSEKQYAKNRGFEIAKILINDINDKPNIEILLGATVVGIYKDHVITIVKEERYLKYKAKAFIIATGASEKALAFENNDLPGIYGAGAIQTLMNLYGIVPEDEVLMVGSGNIGLIVSYQLLQAGVKVKGIVEAASIIGGYKVHASKLKRLGVPFYMQHTIKRAIGKDHLEAVEIVKLTDDFKELENETSIIQTKALCIAVGLSPLSQLLEMMEVAMKYIKELGGHVPVLNNLNQTSNPNIFACGDVSGIEEASSAMMNGYIAGLGALKHLEHPHPNHDELIKMYHHELEILRHSSYGEKTLAGLKKLGGGPYAN